MLLTFFADRNLSLLRLAHFFTLILLSFNEHVIYCGRRGDLMVSALDSRASTPGSNPGRGHCVVLLGKTLYSHGGLSPPRCINGYQQFNAGVTLGWTSIPSRGEGKYSQPLHATETGISSGLMGHSAQMQTLPLPFIELTL